MHTFRKDIRYVEVPNGSIMNDPTNVFIIGSDPVLLIDTGSTFGLPALLDALESIGNPTVSTILLTHVHIDHAESAEEVRRLTGAQVRFHELELPELAETRSHTITLDRPIEHGEMIEHGQYQFEAVLTPGHAAGHLSFIERNHEFGFVGDLITGSGSSAVFPPWGDLSDYINSMKSIAERGTNPLLPSHGEPVTNGPDALRRFVARRIEREQQILTLLEDKPLTVEEVRDRLYDNLPQDLLSDVTGNVILHLEKLEREGQITRIDSDALPRFQRLQDAVQRR
jgi:glyoxylase-like metal-dependent hydrolase (beta-lactamase superfamily II)